MEFYDWKKTFSHSQAEWVFVISARGYGKTYGLRKQCVRDYLKKGRRFVEITRYKSEVPAIGRTYFDKLKSNGEFPGYDFKYESGMFYISEADSDVWECIGYIVALTDSTITKRITFAKVKRFIFDEAVIERKDRFKRYLPGEYERLVGIRSSITRARPGEADDSVVYLLANAVDITCPYFENFGVDKVPTYGIHWYKNRTVMLDYVPPTWQKEFEKNTAVGKALAGTAEGDTIFGNVFEGNNLDYVEQIPKGSKFWKGFVYCGHVFALYLTPDNRIFVRSKAPKNATLAAFTLEDDSIDYDLIKRSGEVYKLLRDFFYKKLMAYESPMLRERYADMLVGLGIL